MFSALGDKKGRSADSSDLTKLQRESAVLAAYTTYTGLSVNKKARQQVGADRKFTLGRGGLTLISDSTTGFTRNPVTGQIVVAPYTPAAPAGPTPRVQLWVAGGFGTNTLAYSSDGITWEPSTSGNSIFTGGVYGIGTNGSMWVAGGTGPGRVGYSSDGINWDLSISGNNLIDNSVFAVAWNGTRWIVVGLSEAAYNIIYSSDGRNWFPSANGNSLISSVRAIAWNGTRWVAGGNGTNRLIYSSDGITWFPSANGNPLITDVRAIAWNGTRWVAGGDGTNTLIYSSDGITWEPSTSGTGLFTTTVHGIGYG
jgi:hypothetical protein